MTPILDTELRVCFAPTFPSGFFIACRGFALVGRTASGGERLRCGMIFSRDPFLTRAAPWGVTLLPPFLGFVPELFHLLTSWLHCLLRWNAVLQPLYPSGRLA